MFTVKATYRGETRKFTFTDAYAFPSFLQLYNQLYRVFPHLSHSYFLSKLLFSPNSSASRILVAREVHNADEYRVAMSNPSLLGRWPSPMLKFSVFDESPHKPTFASDLAQIQWRPPVRVCHFLDPPSSSLSPAQPPPNFAGIPPPPILFSSPPRPQTLPPMDVDQFALPPQPFPTRSPSPQPWSQPQRPTQSQKQSSCCAVAQAKDDIRTLMDTFKRDLDRILKGAFGDNFLDQNMSSQPPQSVFGRPFVPPMPCMYHTCAKCFKLFQGPWQSCQKCARIVCNECWQHPPLFESPCVETLGRHTYKLERCGGCPKDRQPFDPLDPIPPLQAFTPMSFPPLPPPPPPPPPPPSHIPNPFAQPMQPFYTFNNMSPVTPFIPPMVPDTPATVQLNLTPGPRVIEAPKPVETPAAPPTIHYGVRCDCCSEQIEGIRHKCLDCSDYDLCTKCITTGAAERHDPFHEFWEVVEPGRVIISRVGSTAPPAPAPVPVPQGPTPAVSPIHCATCDLCDSRIRGGRYKCANCPDFDTCGSCYAITKEQHPHHTFIKISNPADYLRSNGPVGAMHMAVCNDCNKSIYGVRYKCMHHECLDFDLCERCEAMPISVHPPNHPLLKMKSADTVIPTVYRVGQTTLIDVDADRGRSPLRLSTPLSYMTRSRSRSRSYDRGVLRNPSWANAPLVKGFPFTLRTPSPLPSPPMTIPGALPAFTPMSPLMPPTSIPVPVSDLPTPLPEANSPFLSPSASAYIPPCITPPAEQSPFMTPAYNPTYLTRSPSPPYHPAFNERLPLPDTMVVSLPSLAHTPIPSASAFQSTAGSTTISATDGEVCSVHYPDVVPNSSSHLPSSLFEQFRQRFYIDDDDYAPCEQTCIPDDNHSVIPSAREPSAKSNKASRPYPQLSFPELTHLMEPSLPNSPTPETFLTPVNQHSNVPNVDVAEAKSSVPQVEKTAQDVSPSLPSLPPLRHLSIPDLLISSQESLASETVIPDYKAKAVTTFSHDDFRAIIETKADFVGDVTAPDGQVFPPGAEFMKCWRMKNSGLNDWEESTELMFVAGEPFMRDSGTYVLPVGSVRAGEEVDVWTGELKAPDAPGRYTGYWRLKNGSTGQLFGDSIWIDLVVAEPHRQQASSAVSEVPPSMTYSSVIVMPKAPESLQPLEVTQQQFERLSLSNSTPASPVTAPSSQDVISVAGSEESFSASLVSVPSSDSSDEELWEESRMNASTADSQRTAVPPRSNALDYVVLYDENSSSEDDA